MLLEILQGNDSGGFLLIKGIRHVWVHLFIITCALLFRDEDVHVILFEVSEQELKDGLKEIPSQKLHIHNAYEDPLGWTNSTSFTAQHFSLNYLTQMLKLNPQPKATTLVIDSLSWILRHVSTTNVCSTLHQLKKELFWVCFMPICIRECIFQQEHSFRIDEDLTITVLNKTPNIESVPEEHQMDPTANLTFNLRLSDKEREAKEKLLLPFMFSKDNTEKLLLHSGSGSGRILYEPDASDDYDQEDPDDDLDV
uniref:Elongator complex protein 5 n=1 Tax=Periophthalmus magnuspinnatus TaxID=409849 RepID=A0A3B4BGY0_9GOBI